MDLLPCKFKLEPMEQHIKILSEVDEFLRAFRDEFVYFGPKDNILLQREKRHHTGEECCDVIVSCLTYLHQNYTDEEVQELFKFVNEKNRKRGYLK